MIRINQLKIKSEEVHEAKRGGTPGLRRLLMTRAAALLRVPGESILRLDICRESLDARKKPDLFYSYTLELYLEREESFCKGFGAGGAVCRSLLQSRLSINFRRAVHKSCGTPSSLLGRVPPDCSAAISWRFTDTARFFWSAGSVWRRGNRM